MSVTITPRRFSGLIHIPDADLSFAHFAAAAAVTSGGSVDLLGLDPEDNNVFFGFLEKMGCNVRWEQVPLQQTPEGRVPLGEDIIEELHPFGLHALGVQLPGLHFAEWRVTVSRNGSIVGREFDLKDTPDLLPVLAAVACFAKGDTTIVNIPNRDTHKAASITVIAEELKKLGVMITELNDGLVIHGTGKITQSPLTLNAHSDPLLVMALACTALGCPRPVEIIGAESVETQFPELLEMLADPD